MRSSRHSWLRTCVGAVCSLVLLFSFGVTGRSSEASAAETRWKELLATVQVGMRRAAVEKVLGRGDVVLNFDLEPTFKAKIEKNGRTALYVLDDDWCAAITFDSTGFTTRNNPYLVLHLPENKVVAPPHLLRRTAELNQIVTQPK